jgi:hypothetical protein
MSERQISISVDNNMVLKAEEVLTNFGTDMNAVVNNIIQKLANNEIEPLELKRLGAIPKKHPCSEAYGLLKGQVWYSDDFDEPLEDMKEYME